MVKMDVNSLSDEWLEAALTTGSFHAHGGREIAELAAKHDEAYVNVGIFADFHFPKQGKKIQILDHFTRRCAGLEPIPAPSVPLEWKTAWCSWGNVTSCARQADAWLRLRRPSPHAPFKVLHAQQTAGASSQPHAPQSSPIIPNKRPRPCNVKENAGIRTPAGQGPASPGSNNAAGLCAAASPFVVPHQQLEHPSPASETAGSDFHHQHADQDATVDEVMASEGAAAASVGAGAAAPTVGPGTGAVDEALLEGMAKAADDIAIVARRMKAQLSESAATSAALLANKERDLSPQPRAAANARLEGERTRLQAALATKEQRLLAELEQERAAWRQDRAAAWQQDRAQLEGEKAALQAALDVQRRLLAQTNQEREAEQQEMARIEGRLHEERRERQEHMVRVSKAKALLEM